MQRARLRLDQLARGLESHTEEAGFLSSLGFQIKATRRPALCLNRVAFAHSTKISPELLQGRIQKTWQWPGLGKVSLGSMCLRKPAGTQLPKHLLSSPLLGYGQGGRDPVAASPSLTTQPGHFVLPAGIPGTHTDVNGLSVVATRSSWSRRVTRSSGCHGH